MKNLNIENKIVEIKLHGKTFNAKLDFATISNVQKALKKEDNYLKFADIFTAISEQDFSVIVPFITCCIQRCHPQLKDSYLKDYLTFDAIDEIFEATAKLMEVSLPQGTEEDKKK